MDRKRSKALLILLLLISIFLTTAVYGAPLRADERSPLANAPYVPGQIVVKFKENLRSAYVAQMHASQGATVVAEIPQIEVQVLSVPEEKLGALIAAYQADPRVEYAEPDYIAQVAYEPNDPYYGDGTQWGPQKIQAPLAWDLSTGDPNVVIAIIDSGVDPDHPDLAEKLVTGHNFLDGSSDTSDDYGHGTHVAGIAAAATDNGVGVAGVAFDSKIMPLKVYNKYTSPYGSRIANAMIYAADHGAKVISMSLGNYPFSTTLQNAVNYAWNAGCVLVGSAGNDNSSAPFYPAAFDNVIGVSATDQNDSRASWSNHGSYISVAAPGVSIYSTYWNETTGSTYVNMSGTSMAAPHVAGLAALLFAQDGSRSNATVRSLIEGSADDLGDAGWDQYYGYGRINAYRALMSAVIEPGTGGSLIADGGDITLDFPTGAVTNTTTVTYMPDDAPNDPPSGSVFANDAFVLEATDAEGDPVIQFNLSYTMTLYYQDTDCESAGIDDESTLNLYYWNGSQWQGVLPCPGCSLDTVNNVLVATFDHFSEFGFMGNGNPTSVVVSSFGACSGGAALTPNQATFLRWLALTGLTLTAFGSKGPARARLRKR